LEAMMRWMHWPLVLYLSTGRCFVAGRADDFDQGELAALQANTHVRALIFKKGSLRHGMIDAMCQHPTLERVCIMRRELRRIPGQALLTDVSEMADAGDKAPLSSDFV
jgi:hypothetical protein